MTEVSEFLLARIGEDEAVAERCIRRNRFGDVTSWHPYRHQVIDADLPRGSVAVPAPGFLAECDARRRIVGHCEASRVEAEEYDIPTQRTDAIHTLRLLALPYANHPDYRQEWKP